MEYVGKKIFGGLHLNDIAQVIPKNPISTDNDLFLGGHESDILNFSANENIDSWGIFNTPTDENKKIHWQAFEDVNGSEIYICDRVLMNNISYDDLKEYEQGIKCTIDNVDYICRLMSQQEWDDILCCEKYIHGVPNYISETIVSNDYTRLSTSNHNVFWNYVGISTFIQSHNYNSACGIGYYYASCNKFINKNDRIGSFGFRPVLEKLKTTPIIDGDDGRLGIFEEPFVYNYSVRSHIEDDVVSIKEYLNKSLINEYTSKDQYINNSIDLAPHWLGMKSGNQKIDIVVQNKNEEISSKSASFSVTPATFVHKEGLDYYTTKLWNTKIKPFVQEFGKKTGGLVLDSGYEYGGIGIKENDTFTDNGVCIKGTVDASEKTLALFNTNAVKLGKYGVAIRISTSSRVSSDTIKISFYKKTGSDRALISSKNFKSSDMSAINTYCNLYTTFEYGGEKTKDTSIDIEVKLLSNATTHNIKLDYILISPILPSVFM